MQKKVLYIHMERLQHVHVSTWKLLSAVCKLGL